MYFQSVFTSFILLEPCHILVTLDFCPLVEELEISLSLRHPASEPGVQLYSRRLTNALATGLEGNEPHLLYGLLTLGFIVSLGVSVGALRTPGSVAS